MADINVDIWLYGKLARYGGPNSPSSYANVTIHIPAGSAISNLLARLQLPTEERGITFINGDLSAMPGLQPDLSHVLNDGDRVAFFDLLSMWPFQYRHDANMICEMSSALKAHEDEGIHHSYDSK